MELKPEAHLALLAAAQPLVDSGVSKTVNCPADLPFDAFHELYAQAWRMGCKSLSAFRPNPIRGAVLTATATAARACA